MFTTEKINAIVTVLEAQSISYTINNDNTISCQVPLPTVKMPSHMLRGVSVKDIDRMEKALKLSGQLHPICCNWNFEDNTLVLFDGMQRISAMQRIDPLYSVKVTIGDFDLETSIVANVARVNQNMKQVMSAILYMVDHGKSFKQIASDLNISETEVNKYYGFNYLPDNVKEALTKGEINESVAAEIASACKKVSSGTLTEDNIKLLSDLAIQDKKSATDIRESAKTMTIVNKNKRNEALGISGTPKKVFTFKEKFSDVRLNEIKSKADNALQEAEIDGRELTDNERVTIGVIDYIFCRTAKDKAEQLADWEKKNKAE